MHLQWGDFDWKNFSVMVRRSAVHGRVGDTKTEHLPGSPAIESENRRNLETLEPDRAIGNGAGRRNLKRLRYNPPSES